MRPIRLVIGENVKRYREEKGMTKYKFAKKVGGVTADRITNIEKGIANITIETLDRLIAALDVPQIYLFEDWSDYGINDAIKEADENERWG